MQSWSQQNFMLKVWFLILACGCDSVGTQTNSTCDSYSGKCKCKTGYTGDKCDQCDAGYFSTKKGSSCEGTYWTL